MSPFTIRCVINPSDEVDACACLMYNLQQDVDPAVWLVGGDAALLKDQTAAGIRAAGLCGETYAAQNALAEMIAFSAWMPPGQEIFSTPEQRDLGFNDWIAKLPEDGKEYFLSTVSFLLCGPGLAGNPLTMNFRLSPINNQQLANFN